MTQVEQHPQCNSSLETGDLVGCRDSQTGTQAPGKNQDSLPIRYSGAPRRPLRRFPHTSTDYQDIMTFFYICIILGAVHVSLHSVESVISVSGEEGSTAVLNCKLPRADTQTHIRWHTESGLVFERKGVRFIPGDGYEDRVDVPVEELHKGDCSLVLRNLKLTDKNVYKSSYEVRVSNETHVNREFKDISRVSLSVSGKRSVHSEDISHVSVSEKPPVKKSVKVPRPRGDAQMKFPHPLILVLSLLDCVLFQFF